MKHPSLNVFIVLAVSALVCAAARAGPQRDVQAAAPAMSAETAPAPTTHKKMKMKKPIKMHEPMTTPMAKPGMIKQDVHEDLMHKDAAMKDMMEKEEQDMK